jgi:cellulose synthase (UDP-forming)
MEATHAVTCFAITATLASAIVKPFGRPFKITDKGGDRSIPRVHWKLAATFGLIAASSAASIVWAFVSPYAAGEISPLDFFNLAWAGIAMLIAFIAFLVCFELPRGQEVFEIDEHGHFAINGEVLACRVAALSMSSVQIICPARGDKNLVGAPSQLHLDWLGWIDVSVTARSESVISAHMRPDFEQRKRMVVRLFSSSQGNVTGTARLSGAFAALARRGLRGS